MDLARYAELFRTEVREHLGAIDEALVVLAERSASTEVDAPRDAEGARGAVDALFRAMHTIKGMAGAMGYTPVEQLAHASESLLSAARDAIGTLGVTALEPGFATLCQDAADALAGHVDDAVDGRAPRAIDRTVLERMSAYVAQWDTRAVIEPTRRPLPSFAETAEFSIADIESVVGGSTPSPAAVASRTRVLSVAFDPDAPLKAVRAQLVLTRLEAVGRVQSTEPPVESLTDRFNGEFLVVVESDHDDAALEGAVRSAGDVVRVTIRSRRERQAGRETLRHVRIDLRRLDALLDLVGELVISRDRLLQEAERSADRSLQAAALETSRLVSALQEEILQTRLVPVGHVFDRFPRLVRDVAREVDKSITFAMEGREIALDRSMLDAIGDPIVHLLRNAIDHGIESADEREAAGKPRSGRLVLRALRDRASIVIRVEDDGRGIDRARVLARARAEGRVADTVQTLSDEALIALLAQPGFSTASSVTAVSGRGVGIDVVANRVRGLGGSIDVTTEAGRGTVFSLRLPVTLAIVRALLVRVGEQTYAVPTAHVTEAIDFDEVTVSRSPSNPLPHLPSARHDGADDAGEPGGLETVLVREETLPLVRLRQRFGEPAGTDAGTELIVVDLGGRRVACAVDALLGQQDIVVKSFDAVRGAVALFSGATILGDGKPALIVDVGALA